MTTFWLFFFFWVSIGCSFFFFFSWVGCSVFLFFIFILASVSLGTKKKKKIVPADRYRPTNSVKNIEWWKLGDDAKRVWKIEWWVMSYEWWVMSDRNWVMEKVKPNSPLIFLKTNLSSRMEFFTTLSPLVTTVYVCFCVWLTRNGKKMLENLGVCCYI